MISKRIRQLRKETGMTQAELGSRLGVIKQTISSWETGISNPNNEALTTMAKLFGVSVDYLLGADNSVNESFNPKTNTDFSQKENGFSFFFFDELLKDVFVSRLKKSLTEKELSADEFIKIVSFDADKCEAYLNGKCEPSLEDLIEISHILDVSIDYLLGQIPKVTSLEKKMLNAFVKLDEDNQDIIIGKTKELLKEQRCESSVAADEKYADSQGKSRPSNGTGGGTIAV